MDRIPTPRCTGWPACWRAARIPVISSRRLTRFAVEDVGLADPQAVVQAVAAWEAYERLGSPEGELALVQLVIYLGTAPKSNAAYMAMKAARRAAAATGSLMPPMHILNAPTHMMKELGYVRGLSIRSRHAGRFFPVRTISRKICRGNGSTNLGNGVSNGKSVNGWITGSV